MTWTPPFFLEQAALNGMLVFTDGKLIHYCLIDEETVDGARSVPLAAD